MEQRKLKKKIKVRKGKLKKYVGIGIAFMIFLYPFLHTFIGIDLGDTGYHMYCYTHLFENPKQLSMTGYFTYLIGWLWLQAAGGLGIWGLNLLEVLVEMMMAVIVYRLLAPYLGKRTTLSGILIAVIASDTYLNVFNYHQFHVFLLLLTMTMQFRAMQKGKGGYYVLSGACMALDIFARSGSITSLVTVVFVFYWYMMKKELTWKYLIDSYGKMMIGLFCMFSGCIAFLKWVHHFDYYLSNVFRLKKLAAGKDGGYSIDHLWSVFFSGNLDAFASGFLTFFGGAVLFVGLTFLWEEKSSIKEKIVNMIFGVVIVFVGGYQLVYAYHVNEAPSWPQMTTAPSYLIGICYVAAMICLVYFQWKKDCERVVLLMMAVFLPLLTIAGSNTGTKHVILAFWLLAPFALYFIRQLIAYSRKDGKITLFCAKKGIAYAGFSFRVAVLGVCMVVTVKYCDMVYRTMNFDSIDRTKICRQIHSERTRFLYTTEREADSVNGVLEYIQSDTDYSSRKWIVFGSSILFYGLLGVDAYLKPWVTNSTYDVQSVREDLEEMQTEDEELPYIIWGRTNVYYGFDEIKYKVLLEAEKKNLYGGKKTVLMDFLKEHAYSLGYSNDYYLVFVPQGAGGQGRMDYQQYLMTGSGDR